MEEEIIDAPIKSKNKDSELMQMVKWWESKRLIYNLFVVAFLVLLFPRDWGEVHFTSKSEVIISTIFIIVGANLFYCLGWGIGMLRKFYFKGNALDTSARWVLFVVGTLLSMLTVLAYFMSLYDIVT